MFAFVYHKALAKKGHLEVQHYFRYNAEAEFVRMGISTQSNTRCGWRIDSTVNEGYRLCPSYPSILVVPSDATPQVCAPPWDTVGVLWCPSPPAPPWANECVARQTLLFGPYFWGDLIKPPPQK